MTATCGLRYDNWKLVFLEQRALGTLQVWAEPFTQLRVPKIFNLRLDPYERADVTSNTYYDWLLDHAFLLVPAQAMSASSWPLSRIPPAPEGGQLLDRSGEGAFKSRAGLRPPEPAIQPANQAGVPAQRRLLLPVS